MLTEGFGSINKGEKLFKKITSLTLGWMFFISTISGFVLFVAPPGRVANWSTWSIFGLNKEQWADLHIITTALMVIVAIFHIYFNWRPLISYMKKKDRYGCKNKQRATYIISYNYHNNSWNAL